MADKVTFASLEWLELAREVLGELVRAAADADAEFSLCEVFTDAPDGLAGGVSGRAAWHFFVRGTSVEVSAGEVSNADVRIQADYASTLPQARLVYTPEVIAEGRNAPAPDMKIEGDLTAIPAYLVALHNRLAERTA